MAKRRRTQPAATGKTHGVINGAGEVVEQNIDSTIRENYMPYAMSVILSRAIPEIDGFKPSHRKLLYTMYKMGLLNGARTKSANIVGATMKLNPHGDLAIYDTMVRLSRGYEALLHPYVDSKGNFGKFYSRDMAWAASRYTEAKLDKICNELFRDIDKDTVDFVDNYDNTMKEPSLLPVAFPSVLVNTNTGIAVGMASNICSFNLKEICETTAALIRDPNHDVMQTLPAPDFIGGCQIIYDENALRQVYETGKGGIKLRARYQYDKSANCIDVLSIPSTTTCEVIIEKIIDLVKAGKIKDIADVRDETGIDGLKITIDLKRGADPDKLMAKLYRFTTLEDSFSCNFNVLIGGVPRVLGVKALLEEWIAFRIECVRRRTYFDRNKKAEKLHLLKGLEAILLDIDKAVKIVRETDEEAEVVPNLMIGFGIDEVQAEYVAEIKLRHLNREYILKRTAEIEALEKEIAELDEMSYRRLLWNHRPITDFWRVGRGYSKKLEKIGLYTMGDIARCSIGKPTDYYNEELLYKLFGINAELLIDHAWGYEPCTMEDVKAYKPETNSISSGQVLHCPYEFDKARLVVKEMTDLMVLDLVDKGLVTNQIVLTIGYDIENITDKNRSQSYKGTVTTNYYGKKVPKPAHGTTNLPKQTSSTTLITNAVMELYDKIVNKKLLIRRINIVANKLVDEHSVKNANKYEQLDLFTDYEILKKQREKENAKSEREKRVQNTILDIKKKFGKNAILKGMNLQEGATAKDRNNQIGGHKA